MPFKPGISGNPKGRKPVGLTLAAAVRAKLDPDEWVEYVLRLAQTAEDERVRLAALQMLGDRGWGKPREIVDDRGALTDEQYEEELRIIAREKIRAMAPEDRLRLLDPAPDATIQ